MVDSVSRNWVGGLSSGMDTQGLIDKIMAAERVPVNRLQQKRNTLSLQKSMLQEINLKLFELQNKATDLTFSRTFNSKKVTSSSDKYLAATASTSAKVGSYTLRIKQLATATKVASAGRIAGPLESGQRLASPQSLGGANTTLGTLGVTAGGLQVAVFGGGTHTLDLSALSSTSTVDEMVTTLSNQISANSELKGKVAAVYDGKADQVRLTLLNQDASLTISDTGGGSIVADLFDGSGAFTLASGVPVRVSDRLPIRSGAATTLADLGIDPTSQMTLTRGAATMTLDLGGLTAGSTVTEAVAALNRQIDGNGAFVQGGVATGNPDQRLVEFRYDAGSRKLELVNTNTGDTQGFTLADDTGAVPAANFTARLFAVGGSASSAADYGKKLVSETFPTPVTSGTITIDGVQMSVNAQTDTLQTVLSRITSSTSLNASYDAASDTIRLTRKDGSAAPIGLGSASDTSNFLSVTGLIGGTQAAAAVARSTANLGLTTAQAANDQLGTLSPPLTGPVTAGMLRVTVNGESTDIAYGTTDTLNQVLDRIQQIDGIDEAYYDSSTQRVMIRTTGKGAAATLKLEDLGGGNLAALMNMPTSAVSGAAVGSTLQSGHAVSNIRTTVGLDNAGYAMAVTKGSFTINGVTFTIANPAATTTDAVLKMINDNARVGVKAEFDATGGGIVLTSTQVGNTSIALGAAGDTSNFLTAAGLTSAAQQVGQNAIFSVDGLFGGADQVRQSNQIADVVEGVTFTLKEVTGAAGETVTIAADTAVARKAIDDFLKVYNETITMVAGRLSEKRDYSLEPLTDDEKKSLSKEELESYETAFKTGLLTGDSTLSLARSRMRVAMSGIVRNVDKAFDSLSDLGISTGVVGSSYQDTRTGTLFITDDSKLTTALEQNPDKVAALFAQDGTSESAMGIARRLKEALNQFTKSGGLLTRRVGRTGATSANSEMDKQISLINEQITKQETRMTNRENALIKQFSDLESAMSRYQTQSQAFASQLAQLSGS
ncbi:MAG: flagellar filament capping protein FliD [Candidatus Riflebacteria bacterium]|nr:flagellar filament capping protein FliD [Candidatus Riflebacteria bacterium]